MADGAARIKTEPFFTFSAWFGNQCKGSLQCVVRMVLAARGGEKSFIVADCQGDANGPAGNTPTVALCAALSVKGLGSKPAVQEGTQLLISKASLINDQGWYIQAMVSNVSVVGKGGLAFDVRLVSPPSSWAALQERAKNHSRITDIIQEFPGETGLKRTLEVSSDEEEREHKRARLEDPGAAKTVEKTPDNANQNGDAEKDAMDIDEPAKSTSNGVLKANTAVELAIPTVTLASAKEKAASGKVKYPQLHQNVETFVPPVDGQPIKKRSNHSVDLANKMRLKKIVLDGVTYYIVSAHVMVDKPTIFAAPASSVPLLAKIGGIEYLVIECLISDTGVPFIAIADNDEIPVPFEKVESVKIISDISSDVKLRIEATKSLMEVAKVKAELVEVQARATAAERRAELAEAKASSSDQKLTLAEQRAVKMEEKANAAELRAKAAEESVAAASSRAQSAEDLATQEQIARGVAEKMPQLGGLPMTPQQSPSLGFYPTTIPAPSYPLSGPAAYLQSTLPHIQHQIFPQVMQAQTQPGQAQQQQPAIMMIQAPQQSQGTQAAGLYFLTGYPPAAY